MWDIWRQQRPAVWQRESSADVIIQIAKPVLRQKKLYLITKRVFDIVCSFLGLLILAIPMMIIALIVTIDSPGAPIFKQERLGINGKPFMIYKFRSMCLDAEENGPQWADEQDPRCTHFGQILLAHSAGRASPAL